MKNNTTIVAFHIGRGGRFHNQGHLSFKGINEISYFTNDLFTKYENQDQFKNRFGFDDAGDNQKCILDLITDKNFEELEEKFGISEKDLGEEIYIDGNGNQVGLTVAEAGTGIGYIDIDADYNTTYTKHLSDCTNNEISAIIDSSEWNRTEILSEYADILGYNSTEVALMDYCDDWKETLIDCGIAFDSEGKRVGYIYEEQFEIYETEDEIEGDYCKIGGKFYSKS